MTEQRSRSTYERERVASFTTLDGATHAVTHLIELDYDPEDLAIAPKAFEFVDPRSRAARLDAGRNGAAVGACLAGAVTVVSLVGINSTLGTLIPAVLISSVVGGVLAIVVDELRRRYRAARSFDSPRAEARPTRFDVLVGRARDRARHDLGRWCDPAAVPVPTRRST
jgi:hypothetical protein